MTTWWRPDLERIRAEIAAEAALGEQADERHLANHGAAAGHGGGADWRELEAGDEAPGGTRGGGGENRGGGHRLSCLFLFPYGQLV
jgi:hypothetical protein